MKISFLSIFLILSFGQMVQASPAVGDEATYVGSWSFSGNPIKFKRVVKLVEYDAELKSYKQVVQMFNEGKPPQIDESMVPEDELFPDQVLKDLVENCSKEDGVSEEISVPAGKFKSCRVSLLPKEFRNLGEVPFGLLKLKGHAWFMELESFRRGPGNFSFSKKAEVKTRNADSGYTYKDYEADDYLDYTFDQMASLLGDAKSLLSFYRCDGSKENDPFWLPPRMQEPSDHLKIRLKNGDTFNYQKGILTDSSGSLVITPTDEFLAAAMDNLKKLEAIPISAHLLRLLEHAPFNVYLRLGNNSFNPQIEGSGFWSGIRNSQTIYYLKKLRMSPSCGPAPFSDLGVGGEVYWNPKAPAEALESDGEFRPTRPEVALAHELFHAWDSVRGLLDMRFVFGEDYEFEGVVEYRAVWFENQIRSAVGSLYRRNYSEPYDETQAHKSMLDSDGRPDQIPAICLD